MDIYLVVTRFEARTARAGLVGGELFVSLVFLRRFVFLSSLNPSPTDGQIISKFLFYLKYGCLPAS